MGAYGTQPFDNDSAADWLADLCEHEGKAQSFIKATLSAVARHGEGYLEAPPAEEAVAAAAVVALLTEKPVGASLEGDAAEELLPWLEEHGSPPSEELVSLAIEALDRLSTPPSELLELWAETNDPSWSASIEKLRRQLQYALTGS